MSLAPLLRSSNVVHHYIQLMVYIQFRNKLVSQIETHKFVMNLHCKGLTIQELNGEEVFNQSLLIGLYNLEIVIQLHVLNHLLNLRVCRTKK